MQFSTSRPRISSLPELLVELDRVEQPLSPPSLLSLVRSTTLKPEAWPRSISSHSDQVSIHELYRSAFVEVNFLCWLPGHRSTIHDHRGCACCVKVIDGFLTNFDYCQYDDGTLSELRPIELSPGDVLQRHDRQVHRCENRHPDTVLLTLHFYSPPLAPMAERKYSTSR